MSIFQYLTSRKTSSYNIIISVVISYILKAICSIGHQHVFVNKDFLWSERVIILSVVAAVISVIFVFISELRITNNLLLKINHKSLHEDIWRDIIDYKNGTTLRFICCDGIYTGVLVGHEEKGNDSWFVLEDYIVDEENSEYSSEDVNYETRLAINLKNVKRVELFYGDNSDSAFAKLLHKIKMYYKKITVKNRNTR